MAGSKKKSASKAATDIIETLDAADESVTWAHRGHIIFHNRDHLHAWIKVAQPLPQEAIDHAHLGNLFLKNQQFETSFLGMLKSGAGICVGQPLTAQPALRGGMESEESLAYARQFLGNQVIISSVRCSDEGALQI